MANYRIQSLLMVLLFIVVIVSRIEGATGQTVPAAQKDTSVIGIIQREDSQGVNYLELTVKAGRKSISVLCSGQKTNVYIANSDVYWSELRPGRRIRVRGSWITEEGRKLLWAGRIDVLD